MKAKKGIFVISIDVEMAWGVFDVGGVEKHRKDFEKVRDVVNRLIQVFDEHRIAASWAFVGHLFLDSCEPLHGVNHRDMPRPDFPWFPFDWYSRDPGTDIRRDPMWYGKDLLGAVLSSKIEHEIACHSFSHVDFGHEGCTAEVAKSEVKKCVQLADQLGFKMKSFVYPKNKVGFLEVLRDNGFQVFRGRDQWWSDRFKGHLSNSIGQIIEEFLCLPPRCHFPAEVLSGLWEVPGSMLFRSLNGPMVFLPMSWRIRRAVNGLHRAAAEGKVFQLWFHPWHIANGAERLIDGLSVILKESTRLRELGRMDIVPLGEVPESFAQNAR